MKAPRNRQIATYIFSAWLLLVALSPAPLAASALTLAWDLGTEDDLAGYKVYYGTRSEDYEFVIDVGYASYYTVGGLEPETRYYLALTAYDTSRNESDFSAEVSGVTGDEPDPAPPLNSSILNSGGSGHGGCFIATAAYGPYLHRHLKVLRGFRDEFLIPSSLGRKCVHIYYQYAPPIANHMGKYGSLRFLTRQALLPLIGMGSLSLKTTASQKLLLLPFCLLFIFTITLPAYFRRTR